MSEATDMIVNEACETGRDIVGAASVIIERLQKENKALKNAEITVNDVKRIVNGLHVLGYSAPEGLEAQCASPRKMLLKLLRAVESIQSVDMEAEDVEKYIKDKS